MATPPARRVPAGPQEISAVMRTRLIESRLTPNAISLTGFVLNVVAAVLVVFVATYLWLMHTVTSGSGPGRRYRGRARPPMPARDPMRLDSARR